MKARSLYFDANVFGHIASMSAGVTADAVNLAKKLVNRGTFLFPLSLTVLEEAVVTARWNQTAASAILRAVREFCSLDHILKSPAQLLNEAVESHLVTGETPSVFLSEPLGAVASVKDFVHSSSYDFSDLGAVIAEVDGMKDSFHSGMAEANQKTRDELGIKDGKLPKFKEGRPPTFEEFFRGIGPGLADAAMCKSGFHASNPETLLETRPVRAFAGIGASWIFSQIFENRKLRRSDGFDMRHVVQASVTDGLITNDKPLRDLVSRIDLDGFLVSDFMGLVHSYRTAS